LSIIELIAVKRLPRLPTRHTNSHWNFFSFLFLVRWHWRCISYGRKRFYIFVYFRGFIFIALYSKPFVPFNPYPDFSFFHLRNDTTKNCWNKICDIFNTNYINLNLFCSLSIHQQNFVYFILDLFNFCVIQ
jgi:hypothetical protein